MSVTLSKSEGSFVTQNIRRYGRSLAEFTMVDSPKIPKEAAGL